MRQEIEEENAYSELESLPMSVVEENAISVTFQVSNQTGEPLGFTSYGSDFLLPFLQHRISDQWAWHGPSLLLCGTGLDGFELEPESVATIRIHRCENFDSRGVVFLKGVRSQREYRLATPPVDPWMPFWKRPRYGR